MTYLERWATSGNATVSANSGAVLGLGRALVRDAVTARRIERVCESILGSALLFSM